MASVDFAQTPTNNIADAVMGQTAWQSGQTMRYHFASATDLFSSLDALTARGALGVQTNFSWTDIVLNVVFHNMTHLVGMAFEPGIPSPPADFPTHDLYFFHVNGLASIDGTILATAQAPGRHGHPESANPLDNNFTTLGLFSADSSLTTPSAELGGGDFRTMLTLYGTGHMIGLAHAYDVGNFTEVEAGLKGYDFTRYTVMAYDNLTAGVNATFGNAVTFSAIDIAALHGIYGAAAANTGATTYRLTDPATTALDVDGADGLVSIGRAYYSIWDTGGANEIAYEGDADAVINLNTATLKTSLDAGDDAQLLAVLDDVQASTRWGELSADVQDEITNPLKTAGGFISRLLDGSGDMVDGGFTIADGVTIQTASGGGGGDLLIGAAAGDVLQGNGGADTLIGGYGVDNLQGGDGDDILNGGFHGDFIDGGAGEDTVDYSNSEFTQTINLVSNANTGGYAFGDVLANVENVIGSATRGDVIVGSAGDNKLYGLGADDVLRGHHGDDELYGGDRVDYLHPGNGNDHLDGGDDDRDWAMYNGSFNPVTVDLVAGTGGGPGDDADTIVNIERVRGSMFNDSITGDEKNNTLFGDDGDDVLIGGDGRDNLQGNDGDDVINGGAGRDGLRGQAGSDRFVFDVGGGIDTIVDFTPGADLIDISAFNFADFAAVQAVTLDVNGRALIKLVASTDVIWVSGVLTAELDADDFIL